MLSSFWSLQNMTLMTSLWQPVSATQATQEDLISLVELNVRGQNQKFKNRKESDSKHYTDVAVVS